MTKALTEGQKRARKAMRRACALSGVVLSVAQEAPERETVADVLGQVLSRRCALMGWPDTDANRALARDGRMGALYGRIALAGRWGRLDSDLPVDIVKGLDAWGRLDRQYARIVLGTPHPGDAETASIPDALDVRALADKWIDAQAVIGALPPAARDALRWAMAAGPDVAPATVTTKDVLRIALAGLMLAKHFGLR